MGGDVAELTPDLRQAIAELPWFQTYPLAGVTTPGRHDVASLLRRLQLPAELFGKTVLDVGTNDGFFAFECERRHAKDVVALDHPTWGMAGQPCPPRADGFLLARRLLKSEVIRATGDLERDDWAAEVPFDRFDLILFLGVLYHLKAPLPVLEKLAGRLAPGGRLIVETHVRTDLGTDEPMAAFYPTIEYNGDPTNWWGFNPRGVSALLQAAGFDWSCQVEIDNWPPPTTSRAVFHAGKNP